MGLLRETLQDGNDLAEVGADKDPALLGDDILQRQIDTYTSVIDRARNKSGAPDPAKAQARLQRCLAEQQKRATGGGNFLSRVSSSPRQTQTAQVSELKSCVMQTYADKAAKLASSRDYQGLGSPSVSTFATM